jgi:hypothetical protein
MSVLIINPVAGGVSYVNIRRARHFVTNGRAGWVEEGRSIRFYTRNERRVRAANQAAQDARVAALQRATDAERAVHATIAEYYQTIHVPIRKFREMIAPSPGRRNHHWAASVDRRIPLRTNGERDFMRRFQQ